MNSPTELTAEDASQIAAFTRVACPFDLLSTASIERTIFADTDPQTVLGVYNGGLEAVGAAVVRGNRGWVKFMAVHPRVRRRAIGSSLLAELEAFCRENGAATMEIGTSAPYYVVPGVDVRSTEAVCFFEALGYEHFFEAVNMTVRLHDLPDPSLPTRIAMPDDFEVLKPWVAEEHPQWLAELRTGIELGTCVVHQDLGFACFDVNRDGWFGPIATTSTRRSTGVGGATLIAALHMMRARSYERADIAWATAFPFYVKTVGARIDRVFWWYRKKL